MANSFSDRTSIVNDSASTVGAGWTLSPVERIYKASDGAVLELGDGTTRFFPQTDGVYGHASGEFSTLSESGDGSFRRTLPDQTVVSYNDAGVATSIVTPNGRTMTFAYIDADSDGQSDDLATLTDPTGRQTHYHYAAGLLDSITDFAGRVTQLQHDGAGNLTLVTLPDSSSWQFFYDIAAAAQTSCGCPGPANSSHRLTGLANHRNIESLQYDHTGRVERREVWDHIFSSLLHFEDRVSVETSMLAPQGSGAEDNPAPAKPVVDSDDPAVHSEAAQDKRLDPNGAELVTQMTFDRFSNLRGSLRFGQRMIFKRNDDGLVTRYTDPLARQTTYDYNNKGNLLLLTYPDTSTVAYAYHSVFNTVTSVRDENGNSTAFYYDNVGQLVEVRDALGQGSVFTHDARGNVSSVRDAAGNLTQFTHDAFDRLQTESRPDGTSVSFQYDNRDNVAFYFDERGIATTSVHDPMDRPRVVIDPLNRVTRFDFDVMGNLISSFDPAGERTETHYDALGLVTELVGPLGRIAAYTYNPAHLVASATTGSNPPTALTYDTLGRLTVEARPENYTIQNNYDIADRLLSSTDPVTGQTSFAFDARDRVIRETDALNQATTLEFFAAGQLRAVTDPLGRRTAYDIDPLGRSRQINFPDLSVQQFQFDAVGNLDRFTDGSGRVTDYDYDPVHRLVEVRDPLGNRQRWNFVAGLLDSESDANDHVTHYTYDAAAQLVTMTSPSGAITHYDYDAAGRLSHQINPLGRTTTYGLDPVGNVNSIADRRGWVRQFNYDLDNRLTSEQWLPTALPPSQGGALGRALAFIYNTAGQPLTASDPDSSYTFSYDAAGRPITVDNLGTPSVPRVVLTNTFDAAGNRTRLDDSLGGSVTTAFDPANRPTLITQAGAGITTKQVGFTYNNRGQFASIGRSENGTIITQANYTYDSAGRLTDLLHSGPQPWTLNPGPLQSRYTLGYDLGSRISQVTMLSAAVGSKSGTFSYDKTNQLVGVTGTLNPPESYTYDLAGNRITSQSSSGSNSYTTSTGNRLASDGQYNYTYDAEGNLVMKSQISNGQSTTYNWDHRNRLVAVQEKTSAGVVAMTAAYGYDVFDRRIAKQAMLAPGVAGRLPGDNIGVFAVPTVQFLLDTDGQGHAPERTLSLTDPQGRAIPGGVPVSGDWNGDGIDEIGLVATTTGSTRVYFPGIG